MTSDFNKKEVKALIKWRFWHKKLNSLEAKGVHSGRTHARYAWNVQVMDKVLDSQFLDKGTVLYKKLNEKAPLPAVTRQNLNKYQIRLAKRAVAIQDYL